MGEKSNTSQILILTGDAGKDFSSFLRSKEKKMNFEFGLSLIQNYTKNRVLPKFLFDLEKKDADLALKKLVSNLKIIQRQWKK